MYSRQYWNGAESHLWLYVITYGYKCYPQNVGKGAEGTMKSAAQYWVKLAQTIGANISQLASILTPLTRWRGSHVYSPPPKKNPQYLGKGSSTNENVYGTIQHKPSTNEWHQFQLDPSRWGGLVSTAPPPPPPQESSIYWEGEQHKRKDLRHNPAQT